MGKSTRSGIGDVCRKVWFNFRG